MRHVPRSVTTRSAYDLSATIEAAANLDVQPPSGRMFARQLRQAFGSLRRWSECKPRRPPGALPDSMRASGIERCKDAGNSGACKASSALRPREIIAEPGLQLFYGTAEADDVLLRKCR